MQSRYPGGTARQPSVAAKSEQGKSVIVVPSRMVSRPDEVEGAEETEIAAQITVPQEGGWGWVVVFAAFLSIFVLDGVAFTFGSVFQDITLDLEVEESLVAMINSLAVALYFSFGPLTSALINRFGFRAVTMAGSVIVSFALLCSYFATSYAAVCIFYGAMAGIGYCLINLSSALVVGFYFEKLRSLALAIAAAGSSFGVMVMFPLNSFLVKRAGWRSVTLLHSGMFGLIFFLGMTYRPLMSVTVTKTTDTADPTRTVTYLPNVSSMKVKSAPSRMKAEQLMPTATEKLFSAVSNYNFPTAAAIVEEDVTVPNSPPGAPGPSTAAVSKLTLTAHSPRGGISHRQLKQVQSMMSKSSVQPSDKTKRNVEVTVKVEEPHKKVGCCGRLCNWEEHIEESRPMYRDDAFFDGKIETLQAYQKSRMLDHSAEQKTGLEYQLAVSRAVTTVDLHERRGVFTTAVRRILATMMDPKLLRRPSFLMFCISGFLIYLGFLVPYVFIPERNRQAGIEDKHCNLFVSTIGGANALGRFILGALGCKFNPLKIFAFSCLVAGIATILSTLSYNVIYQYAYCSVFGFFVASLASLRSMALVDLYGLERLTNATGIMLLFQGFGSILCTPAATMVKNKFGYPTMFTLAGIFIFLSGLCLVPIKMLSVKEDQKETEKQNKIAATVPKRVKT